MEAKPSGRQPPEGIPWWVLPDEGYWRALLEQGEIVPVPVPPRDFQESFPPPAAEAESELLAGRSDADGQPAAVRGNPWQMAHKALDSGECFSVRVMGYNRGGLLIEWDGLEGFVPASHLIDMPHAWEPQDRTSQLSRRVGDFLTVRLIEVDEQQHRLVFSERAAVADPDAPAALLNRLHPGDVCRGTVVNLTSFGAFVDLGGIEGLIHISEMSWERLRQPSDVLHPGEEIQVYVLGVNAEEGRIALSLKRLRPNPWADVELRYRVGQVVEGTVTNVVSFGAFVRLEEGLEGLIHVSELADGSFVHPRSVVREGETVLVRVLNVEPAKRRLGLSLRQARSGGLL